MKEFYQKKAQNVKQQAIQILDQNVLLEKAAAGLLATAKHVGMEVLYQMMEGDVEALAGPKGKHKKDRDAYRHGTDSSTVILGGQKVPISRPRVRQKNGAELPIKTLTMFQKEDPLNDVILSRLLHGVSTRKYKQTIDGLAEGARCVSKSEVSRRFIAGMEKRMQEFFERQITENYCAMMIDGMQLGDMTIIAAMGIDDNGKKQMLGLTEGGTENSEVIKDMLTDMIKRGLRTDEPRLYVLDGGKALAKAVKDTFGGNAAIQRCQVHKKRNVLSYLPESEQQIVSMKLTLAYREAEYSKAKARLEEIVKDLHTPYPKAAESLKEGLEETLTVCRLKVPGLLRETLSNTNAIESANSICAGILRNVKNFKNGGMSLRHAAAGFMEAEKSFHRVRGYGQIQYLRTKLKELTKTGSWPGSESLVA